MPAKNPKVKPNPIPNIAITSAKGLEEINLELLGISFKLEIELRYILDVQMIKND
jgi:hypothetical protein